MLMMSNLQRARQVVTERCIKFQDRERHISTQNEERRKNTHLEILILKPTRIVGGAEKLLHQWHGPFIFMMRTNLVNYLVNVATGKKPKTEVVHVERIKKFHETPIEEKIGPVDSPLQPGCDPTENDPHPQDSEANELPLARASAKRKRAATPIKKPGKTLANFERLGHKHSHRGYRHRVMLVVVQPFS